MNNNITKINQTSLVNLVFANDYYLPKMQLDFKNIVFAKNGAYSVIKNEFGIIYDKIESLCYSNSKLSPLPNEFGIYLNIPKPKIKLLNYIIEMFKYVNDKSQYELTVNVYYNKKDNDFCIDIVDQHVNGVVSKFEYTKKFEMNGDYIRYLQIHSHNTMSAKFSSQDDKDETNSIPCFFGVIGKLESESQYYNVDKKFRVWTGVRFIEIDLHHIFDVDFFSGFPDMYKKKLDEIIRKSKEKNRKMHNDNLEILKLFGEDDNERF